MPYITNILVSPKVITYLEKRKLVKQFRKSMKNILQTSSYQNSLKRIQPKEKGIRTFRINKQFRAVCVLEKNTLVVHTIDNHQNL